MRFGKVDLHLVSDGSYWEDGAGHFGLMPKVEWQEIQKPDERNRVPLVARCLLVYSGSRRILVDTGFGDKMSEKERSHIDLEGDRRLLGELEALGVGADDVDVVINTHLHSDHCGGNTRHDDEGKPVPTFPRATYYVQRQELADATYPNERTRAVYLPENLEPVQSAGQLRVVSGDTRLDEQVRLLLTPGHTPGHQSVVIESEGRAAIFLADVANWPFHMEQLARVTAFDVQPLVNIETKRRLALWAVENEVLLLFDHHPTVKGGYLRATGRPDHFCIEPVEI